MFIPTGPRYLWGVASGVPDLCVSILLADLRVVNNMGQKNTGILEIGEKPDLIIRSLLAGRSIRHNREKLPESPKMKPFAVLAGVTITIELAAICGLLFDQRYRAISEQNAMASYNKIFDEIGLTHKPVRPFKISAQGDEQFQIELNKYRTALSAYRAKMKSLAAELKKLKESQPHNVMIANKYWSVLSESFDFPD